MTKLNAEQQEIKRRYDAGEISESNVREFMDTGTIGKVTPREVGTPTPTAPTPTTPAPQNPQTTAQVTPNRTTPAVKVPLSEQVLPPETGPEPQTFENPGKTVLNAPIKQSTEPVKKEVKPLDQQIIDIASFKRLGGGINELSELIEERYGVSTKIQGEKMTADINGERFEWKIDKDNNPVKISLGRTDNQYSAYAQEKGIATEMRSGEVMFKPQSIDEAMGLINQFGTGVKFLKEDGTTIKAFAGMKYVAKYQGASTDVLVAGMTAGEVGTSGEVWENLIRLNRGEATYEMLEAKRIYEENLRIGNVNADNGIIQDELLGDGTGGTNGGVGQSQKTVQDYIKVLDDKYDAQLKLEFKNLDISFAEFKASNEELSELNEKLNLNMSEIDELEVAKRKILKDIKARYPNMDLGSQIDLYNQQADAIDDQLFVLQRTYNATLSTFNFKTDQAQAEYEFNIKKSERRLDFIDKIYGRQRGDLIYERDIQRADKLISDQIVQNDKLRIQAIEDMDIERVKQLAYEKELLIENNKINKKMGQQFGFQNIGDGILAKTNAMTGEVEFVNSKGGKVGEEDMMEGGETVMIDGAEVVLGSIGVPVDFERAIKNQIPATLLNSEIELEAANDVIKNLYKAGYSKEEASEIFQGFKIDKIGDASLAKNLLTVSRSVAEKPEGLLASLSANINTGGHIAAVNMVENIAEKAMPEGTQTKAKARIQINRLNAIDNYLNEIGDKGILGSKLNEKLGKFKSPEIAKLESLMATYSAEKSANLFGTGEANEKDASILTLGEYFDTIRNKIGVFKDDELSKLNSARTGTLPKINEKQLLDQNAFLKLYQSQNMFGQTGNTSSAFNSAVGKATPAKTTPAKTTTSTPTGSSVFENWKKKKYETERDKVSKAF